MKPLRFLLCVVVLMSLSMAAFAQSDAQKSFDKLKTLAGSWEGTLEGGTVHISLRVTSMGNAILHEMKGGGPENPITMLYIDGDRLVLTHYCDAGNRPRMVGTMSPDGKTLTFNFLERHRQHAGWTHAERRLQPHRLGTSHRNLELRNGGRKIDGRSAGAEARQ